MQAERIQDIIIIALAAIAIVLGGLILERETEYVSTTWDRIVSMIPYEMSESNEGNGTPNTGGGELEGDIRAQLTAFPGPDATQDEITEHATLINEYAQEADVIAVGNCSAEPFVYAGTVGDTVEMQNMDDAEMRIAIGPEISFTIGAGETRDITDILSRGAGIYAYACNQQGVAGVINLMPSRE